MSGRINLDNMSEDFKSYIQGLDSQLEQITNYIDPDTLSGNDTEKLQKAIDLSVQSNIDCEIRIHRVYDITGNTLYLNRDKDGQKQYYQNHVKIIGINGGIIKKDQGYWFSSSDLPNYEGENECHYTGDFTLKNLFLKGSEQNNVILIDGDKLIRVYLYDNDINHIGCLVKSTTYTQTIYCLRNKIREGIGTLLDTENNYDLNFSDNLVEWCENFFTFSGANGCRITNNLIEGLKGYTVVAKGLCQSLTFDNNYFELNRSYFDLTNLKGYGLTLKNSYVYDTDSSKTFISLPTKHFGDDSAQDQYTFISNVCSGPLFMYEFKNEPQSEIKIISIGCTGHSRNYNDKIQYFGKTYSETNGTIKSYYRDGLKCITNEKGMEIDSEQLTTIDIDMGETIRLNDIISVSLIESSGKFDLIQLVNVYPVNNTVKVVVKGTGAYVGTMHCIAKVSVLKTPYTTWF